MFDFLHRAWAEVHLDRLENNVSKCRSLIEQNTELMAVVKADCYGHSDEAVVPFMESKLKIKWFAVSHLHEAQKLRDIGIKGEVLILGYTPPEHIGEVIKHNLIQTVSSFEYLKELERFIPENEKVRVHIKIDTGMSRLGIRFDTAEEYADECVRMYKEKGFSFEGMFTHLSVADSDIEENVSFTKNQIKLIREIASLVREKGYDPKSVHYLNSAGATRFSDGESSLARFGIMLYGLKPDFDMEMPIELEPVMELKALVSQVKELKEGADISYGRTYKVDKPMKIAVLTIGYADGYSRLLSGKAEVLINGKRAKSVGRICMDQMMVDVTDIDVKPGDVATLFGSDGEEKITADELASLYGTIGYEIVCGISKRVQRVIKKDGKIVKIVDKI